MPISRRSAAKSTAEAPAASDAAVGAAAPDAASPQAAAAKPEPKPEDKPTLVLFVRHGTTPTTGQKLPGRAKGLHLAPKGLKEAADVAKRLGKLKGITALYASPLERTRETAAPIGTALGLKVKREPGLLECDFGTWTGAELKDLFKLPEWGQVQRSPSSFRFPEGESFVEMQTRITSTVADLVARHPGQKVVVVSHADPIKAAVAAAIGTHLDLFQRIVVSTCSVSAVLYSRTGAPVVLAVNSTGADLRTLVPS